MLPNEEDRLALQEYAGYTLYPKLPFHKIAFLVGSGRNGKGVFTRTNQNILGVDNVSNICLDQLNGSHKFAATNLYGKLMNISSEPSTRWPLQTELLKQLTGEDWLDGEVKGKQNPVKFQPFAKHFVLANKLPKVSDTSIGWWDRVLIVIWEQTFTEEQGNQVVDLEDTWLKDEADRSGILNWLIEGWVRLSTNGRFTQSKTQREAMIQFKRASDPIGVFLTEECEYDPEYYEMRDKVYDSYKDYAQSLNTIVEGNRVFFERVRQVPGVSVDRKKRIEGKAQRIVSGLKIRGHDEEGADLNEFLGGEESEGEADETLEAHLTTREKINQLKEEEKEGVKDSASSASSASPGEEVQQKPNPEIHAKGAARFVLKLIGNPANRLSFMLRMDNPHGIEEARALREDFPIPLWEPLIDVLMERMKNTKSWPGGYRWLFPSPMIPEREESKGVQKWILERFGLEARAWLSPERAYQKVRLIGERQGLHIFDHWFRSQRATMLNHYYKFNEQLLHRFFTWAGGWDNTQPSMGALYARTSLEELTEKMQANKTRLLSELKEPNQIE